MERGIPLPRFRRIDPVHGYLAILLLIKVQAWGGVFRLQSSTLPVVITAAALTFLRLFQCSHVASIFESACM